MSAPGFYQRAGDARLDSPVGFIGDVVARDRSRDGVNSGGQAKQVTTIAIPGSPSNDTVYTATIDGVACSFTTDGSATTAELGEGLKAAIEAQPAARAAVVPTFAGSTLTLTATWPGIAVVVAASGTSIGTPTTATSAASPDGIEFGRLLVSTSAENGNPQVSKPTSSVLSAQVQTHTITSDTGGVFSGFVKVNGKVYQWGSEVHDTNADTTAENIKDAINAVLPANTVVATRSTADVVLTAEVVGVEFDSEISATGAAGAGAAKAYTTGPSISTSLVRAAFGISVRRLDVENETLNGEDPAYKANAVVDCLVRGRQRVQRDTSETIARGDEVYVSVASATAGRFYNAAGADRVWVPSSKLVWDEGESSSTSDGIASLAVHLGS